MTEVISINKLSPKKVETSAEKKSTKERLSQSIRKSSAPQTKVFKKRNVREKKNGREPMPRSVGRYRGLKQTHQKSLQSLDAALKGIALSQDQRKKKKLLEKSIFKEGDEPIRLSQYLHESGFSYESQASLVCIKKVETYMINYLSALFFKETENPLNEVGLVKEVLKRISGKWDVLKDIMKELGINIPVDEVVLSLFKNQGAAYLSLIVFLDLFESDVSFLSGGEETRLYPKYETLKYPAPKTQFISDFLEIAKGGGVCLKAFVKTFVKASATERSEWEQLLDCLWDDLLELSKNQNELTGGTIRYNQSDWNIVSDDSLDFMKRKLNLVNQENPEIELLIVVDDENKKVYILKEDMSIWSFGKNTFFVKNPDISEAVFLNHFIKCIKARGGAKNKQSFMDCFIGGDFCFDGERSAFFTFLRSEKGGGLSSFEALNMISKCIGSPGGSKNKTAFLECLSKREVALDGELVSLHRFLTSDRGGGIQLVRNHEYNSEVYEC